MSTVLSASAPTSFEIKSAQLPLVALLLKSADLGRLAEEMKQRYGDIPDFFDHDPLLVDLSPLQGGESADSPVDFPSLIALLRQFRLEPVAVRGGNEAQAFRDVDSVREFMTGAGILSFCDVPWIPVFIGVAFILHPYFGILAIIAGALIFGLAVANDYVTRDALKRAATARRARCKPARLFLARSAFSLWQGRGGAASRRPAAAW